MNRYVLAPIGFRADSVEAELLKQRNTLAKQLEIAMKFIEDMIINDGTHADISILAERAKHEIKKIENEND